MHRSISRTPIQPHTKHHLMDSSSKNTSLIQTASSSTPSRLPKTHPSSRLSRLQNRLVCKTVSSAIPSCHLPKPSNCVNASARPSGRLHTFWSVLHPLQAVGVCACLCLCACLSTIPATMAYLHLCKALWYESHLKIIQTLQTLLLSSSSIKIHRNACLSRSKPSLNTTCSTDHLSRKHDVMTSNRTCASSPFTRQITSWLSSQFFPCWCPSPPSSSTPATRSTLVSPGGGGEEGQGEGLSAWVKQQQNKTRSDPGPRRDLQRRCCMTEKVKT